MTNIKLTCLMVQYIVYKIVTQLIDGKLCWHPVCRSYSDDSDKFLLIWKLSWLEGTFCINNKKISTVITTIKYINK